jgi:hypothetical protein
VKHPDTLAETLTLMREHGVKRLRIFGGELEVELGEAPPPAFVPEPTAPAPQKAEIRQDGLTPEMQVELYGGEVPDHG